MTDRDDATPTTNTTQDEGSVRGEGTVGKRLVERLSITQAMLDDNETLRAEIERMRLTDAERAAVHWFAHFGLPEHRAATLRNLLERLHS